jgi:hypothetical protein
MPQVSFDSTELPVLQPRCRCVLIPRDPNFIYAYWNYSQEDISGDSQLILRVYDITRIKFNGSNAKYTWDLDVGFSTKNWYIHVWQDNADYCAELGIRYGENHFIPLTRSNIVRTPPKSASKRDDLIWQDIKAHKESRPYIKEKSHKVKQTRKVRIYQLTVQDIRAYYMKLFSWVSRRGKKLKGVSWQKVRPLMTNPDLIKEIHPGASGEFSENKGASERRLNNG